MEQPRVSQVKLASGEVGRLRRLGLDFPRPTDLLVSIDSDGTDYYLTFESTRTFYAKHLMAVPRWLIVHGLMMAWDDLRGIWYGRWPRQVETLRDYDQRKEQERGNGDKI